MTSNTNEIILLGNMLDDKIAKRLSMSSNLDPNLVFSCVLLLIIYLIYIHKTNNYQYHKKERYKNYPIIENYSYLDSNYMRFLH